MNVVGNFSRLVLGSDVKILPFKKTIAHAAILGLPTAGGDPGHTQLVAAPASGFARVPLWAWLVGDFTAAGYTVNGTSDYPTSGWFSIETNDGGGFGLQPVFNAATDTVTGFTDFFAIGKHTVLLMPTQLLGANTAGLLQTPVQTFSDFLGNIVLTVNNNGSGNFTGGNSGNSLKIWGEYAEITL